MRRFSRLLVLILLGFVSACAGPTAINPTLTPADLPGVTPSNTHSPAERTVPVQPTETPRPTASKAATLTPFPSLTSTSTLTLTPTVTPTWTYQGPGAVKVPILLYHHIAEPINDSRYYVSPEAFKAQMEDLAASGYTSISMATLVEVMKNGGVLPARPVIITFDDGNLDVYTNALPVMKALGFTGTVYVVTKALNDPKYLSVDILKELLQDGWEVGSHTKTHSDLTKSSEGIKEELYQSRKDLETALGVPIKSIAYPFGIGNDYIFKKAREYGYESGAGLGGGVDHKPATALYLARIEVRESYSLGMLGFLLPWWEGPIESPTVITRTATP